MVIGISLGVPATWIDKLAKWITNDERSKEIATSGRIDERDFQVRIGHVYAHLNRVWNGRNRTDEITDDQWERMSQFPQDLIPVG